MESKQEWQNLKEVTKADMSQTNEEFFKQGSCMYYTDEVQLKQLDSQMFVNEF